MNKPKILAIVGPTASGKSDLAVELALKFNGEVISADSRQVYRGLDIGTGKITHEEMLGVPHHLLDVADPDDQYSVALFKQHAESVINDILYRGKLPIIAGGTGFYIESIVDGITPPEVPANPKLRAELESLSIENLQQRLADLDPDRLNEIDENNSVRLIRAIEIAETLGTVPEITKHPKYDVLQIGLHIPIDELRLKIRKRLEARLTAGMIEEVQTLHENGLSWERMESLGLEYRYIARYLQNIISKEEMIETLNIKIGQYAKRQISWFKRDERIYSFKLSEKDKIEREVENFIK